MRIVALGELLLRLRAPGAERLLQAPHLEAGFGGSEFNVLACLSRWGMSTDYVSALPQAGLGNAALATLHAHGVGTRFVQRAEGRLGLYFLESGSGVRAPRVLYDRAGSVFALSAPATFDWEAILAGAHWLHLSGITPAVSETAAATAVAAARAAQAANVPLSLDINMRAQLWALSGRDPLATLAPLLAHARVVFATPADAPVCLPAAQRAGSESAAGFAAAIFAHCPRLELLVSAGKRGASATDFTLFASAQRRGAAIISGREIVVAAAIERIGAGDALVAGCLYGLLAGWPEQRWLDFALAAQALKHTIPGDINLVSREEVEAVVGGVSPLRVQR
ncbi:MAG TPA: sugar kinase [Steroidobacteraceae bacterium]|nr:sugar kinase [Steroidobacteraceae bacterium]